MEPPLQVPCFRDLLPNFEGVGHAQVSDLLVKIIVEMVLLAKTAKTGRDLTSIEGDLDSQLGIGIMRPNLRKVVALITQVSEWVKDGKNRVKLLEYVKGRLDHAAYMHAGCGGELLDSVVGYLKDDLLDCKTSTVFHRCRAA